MFTIEQEIFMKDLINVTIGLYDQMERSVRFNLARLLLKWYSLVLKGEDIDNESARELREQLETIFRGMEDVQKRVSGLLGS